MAPTENPVPIPLSLKRPPVTGDVSGPSHDAHSLYVTSSAVDRLRYLLTTKEKGKRFRIQIDGGGCFGFKYTLSFDGTVGADDWIYETEDVGVIVDNASMAILSGTILDFESTMMNSMFVLKNPNAKGGCGCGNSFSPF